MQAKKTLIAVFCLILLGVGARADDKADAIAAAQKIMSSLGNTQFALLWENQASSWFKDRAGTKDSFVANMSLSRSMLGKISSSKVVDVQYADNDPSVSYKGDIYIVNFFNTYPKGKYIERIVMIKDGGSWKLSGMFAVPAP